MVGGPAPPVTPTRMQTKKHGNSDRKLNLIRSCTRVRGRCVALQQTRVYPYPLGAGPARPNPKMGGRDPENSLFIGFSVLIGGLRPWSQTMVSEGARPWGGGRSGDCELHVSHEICWGSSCRASIGIALHPL